MPVNETFIPTAFDRETVRRMKSVGVKEAYIRLAIKHPKTKRPIAKATFAKAFASELIVAKAEVHNNAISVYFEGLHAVRTIITQHGKVEGIDWEARLKCADRIRHLCSKGIYEDKFNLPVNATPEQMLNAAARALDEGKASTFEADALTKAANAMIAAKEANIGSRDITIMIDHGTADKLPGVFTDGGTV